MSTKRVYHPETNEPFDIVESRAIKLVLEKGWLQTPIIKDAVPAVSVDTRPRGKKVDAVVEAEPAAHTVTDDWRGTESGPDAAPDAEEDADA